ncbi:hypothetical protein L195_g031337, partial [Trifolium pratense]
NGTWKCYKGSGDENKELVFGVKRSVKTLTRVELEVLISGERLNDDVFDLKVIGSPFKRSCSIYKDADLVAQIAFCPYLSVFSPDESRVCCVFLHFYCCAAFCYWFLRSASVGISVSGRALCAIYVCALMVL